MEFSAVPCDLSGAISQVPRHESRGIYRRCKFPPPCATAPHSASQIRCLLAAGLGFCNRYIQHWLASVCVLRHAWSRKKFCKRLTEIKIRSRYNFQRKSKLIGPRSLTKVVVRLGAAPLASQMGISLAGSFWPALSMNSRSHELRNNFVRTQCQPSLIRSPLLFRRCQNSRKLTPQSLPNAFR